MLKGLFKLFQCGSVQLIDKSFSASQPVIGSSLEGIFTVSSDTFKGITEQIFQKGGR